jgi:hypothetical protein
VLPKKKKANLWNPRVVGVKRISAVIELILGLLRNENPRTELLEHRFGVHCVESNTS